VTPLAFRVSWFPTTSSLTVVGYAAWGSKTAEPISVWTLLILLAS
jgi:hypothetical protein